MIRHSVLYSLARLGAGLLTVATLAVFTRMLTPSDYGLYAIGMTIASISSTLLFQWLNVAVGRFYPMFIDRPGVLVAATRRGFVIASLIALACFLVAAVFGHRLGVAFSFLLLVILATFALGFYNLMLQMANAKGNSLHYALLSWIKAAVTLAAGALFIFLGGAGRGAFLGVISGIVFAVIIINPLKGVKPLASAEASKLGRTLFSYGMPLTLTFLGSLAVDFADRLLIAWRLGTGQVGPYAAAYDFTTQAIGSILNILFLAAFPFIVRVFDHEGEEAVRTPMRSLGRSIIVLGLPAAVGFSAVSVDVAHLLLGESFRSDAARIMPIMAGALWLFGFKAYYLDVVFQLRRVTSYQAFISLAMMVLNVTLNVALLSRYGIVAAAWATVAAFALGATLSFYLGRRLMTLHSLRTDLLKTAAASGLMAVIILLVPGSRGISLLVVKVTLGVAAYIGLAWMLNLAEARTWLSTRG